MRETHFHHEESFSAQTCFKLQVLALVEAINELGNPFLYNSPDLLSLDTHDIMDASVVETVCTVEALGKEQYNDYHKSVVLNRERSTHEPIAKNYLALFRRPKPKAKTKGEERQGIQTKSSW